MLILFVMGKVQAESSSPWSIKDHQWEVINSLVDSNKDTVTKEDMETNHRIKGDMATNLKIKEDTATKEIKDMETNHKIKEGMETNLLKTKVDGAINPTKEETRGTTTVGEMIIILLLPFHYVF